jgi:cyclopropane fatty-acyl-phospholipid synthase-like methyltransferase
MTQPDHSPSADRNKHPILAVLQGLMASSGRALEIASGTGQHVVWFAQHFPNWSWQPTDLHKGALFNIEVRAAEAELTNVDVAQPLDVCKEPWFPPGSPLRGPYDLILCINMLHIAPWQACGALMRGAATNLTRDGVLVTYGPYFESGVEPTASNIEFDASLRTHNPLWGIRQLTDVQSQATAAGLRLKARHALPAHNLLLVWELKP